MAAPGSAPRRIRPLLLVLLWFWAACVFVVLDLFLNIQEFDSVRPRSRLYHGMRLAAHEMIGENVDNAAGPSAVCVDRFRRSAEVREVTEIRRPPDGELRDGRREGVWTWWHGNGKVRSRETYQCGVRHGSIEQWYPDGLRECVGEYERGKRCGSWVWWHANGVRAAEEHYRDGVLDGPVVYFHLNGAVAETASYSRGMAVGKLSSLD